MTDRRERMTAASPLRGRQHRNDNSAQSIIRIQKRPAREPAQSSERGVEVQQRADVDALEARRSVDE